MSPGHSLERDVQSRRILWHRICLEIFYCSSYWVYFLYFRVWDIGMLDKRTVTITIIVFIWFISYPTGYYMLINFDIWIDIGIKESPVVTVHVKHEQSIRFPSHCKWWKERTVKNSKWTPIQYTNAYILNLERWYW